MLKSFLPFFALLFTHQLLTAQCPDLDLSTFQNLQRAEIAQKEAAIEAAGFDLHSLYAGSGINYRRYRKCWSGKAAGKDYYEQMLIWNTSQNTLTLAFLKQPAYLALRQSIEGRQNSADAVKGGSFYIGKMFRYEFGRTTVDGANFYTIDIDFKR